MAIVKVYSTPSCPYCELLKQFLYEKGVKFEVVDVSDNESAQNYIFEKTGKMAVPVIEIDNEIIVGFDKPRIMELLNLKD
ncbi:MAG: NrdH-redoxin [Parcubacteria group bacterium CG08_land_8_20_14_0_20_43_9]|nr:MAG: NrdH-redoxin [Parcubacteria group bacterium CG08_land_8_20_14_0_20_43_9]